MTKKLLVGLGNPGAEYRDSRHNVGFRLLDKLVDEQALTFNDEKKFNAAVASWRPTPDLDVSLVKPLCFMNNSGETVGQIARYYHIDVDNITVIHDDLDMAEGKLRIKKGGGAGGHNGIKSLNLHVGNGYTRVKIGIGRPTLNPDITHWVLSSLTPTEQRDENILFACLLPEITTILEGNNAKATSHIQMKLRELLIKGA
ncbi:MAG: aminoacyl-tRNA hydrolase [Mariprofundales bacterium]